LVGYLNLYFVLSNTCIGLKAKRTCFSPVDPPPNINDW